jgi:hypothetical protein
MLYDGCKSSREVCSRLARNRTVSICLAWVAPRIGILRWHPAACTYLSPTRWAPYLFMPSLRTSVVRVQARSRRDNWKTAGVPDRVQSVAGVWRDVSSVDRPSRIR